MTQRPRKPPGDSDERIPAIVFNAISASEDRHVKTIEDLRTYFVSQVDELRKMISAGATKEEVREKLEQVRLEVVDVKQDVSNVSERLDTVKKEIMEKMDEVSKEEQEKQKKGYTRVIAFQATALVLILSPLVAVLIQILLHR